MKKNVLILLIITVFSLQSFAQKKVICGELYYFEENVHANQDVIIKLKDKAILCDSVGKFKLCVSNWSNSDSLIIKTIFSVPIYISHFDETKDTINLGKIYLIESCPIFGKMIHFGNDEGSLERMNLDYETNIKPKYDSCLTVKEEMLETIHDKKYQLFKQENNSYIFIDYRSCIINK